MSQITIKELSKILNLSVSTVSKALNDSHEISLKTKERVVKAAKLNNYQPNLIAKRLKYGKTFTLAVIIPSIQDSFFMRVLHGIEEAASHTEYNIITCSTRNHHEKEKEIVNNLASGIVDGFIIAPAKETILKEDFSHFEYVINANKPIVWIDRGIDSVQSCVVKSNNTSAVYNATKKLIEKGRKKIAIISYNNELSTGKDRIKGYTEALIDQNLEIDSSLILQNNDSESLANLKSFITKHKVDGIICTDEASSFNALKALKELKIKSKDVSIIGYTDEKVAQNLSPELTTINQHRKTIGEIALKTLIEILDSTNPKSKNILIDSTLEIRDSF